MGTKEPKSKKAKVTKKEEEEENEEEEEEEEEESVDDDDDDDNDDDEEEEDDEEEDKKAATVGTKKNEDGEAYFELSDMRRLVVRKFKGATLIDIREFYEKGGKTLPGKKGISLSLDQYNVLLDLTKRGLIDKEIAKLK